MTECSVIPESTTQDGLLGSIAAALYHEFGHALGLPDLYSTLTGLPTVGWWDLMDSGTNLPSVVQFEVGGPQYQVTGLLPPSIGLWCKWWLGWVDVQRVGADPASIELPASFLQSRDDKALMLDTGGDEFFLVENRWVPPLPARDPKTGAFQWLLISDESSGVVLYLGENEDVSRPPNTHMYDFFLPWAGGAMVWRVRQDLIDQRIQENLVQGVAGDFGLEIVEADGLQDIGVFDFRTFGFVGSDTDCFRDFGEYLYPGPEDVFAVDYDSTTTAFGPGTTPSSESALRVPTGAAMWSIGRSDTVMTLQAAVDPSPVAQRDDSAFPVILDPLQDATGPVPWRGQAASVTHLAGNRAFESDAKVIVAAAEPADDRGGASLFAWKVDGTPAVGADPRWRDLDAPVAGPIAFLPSFRGAAAFAWATQDGTLEAHETDLAAGQPFSGFPVALGSPLTDGPVELRDGSTTRLACARREGRGEVFVVEETGLVRDEWTAWSEGLGLSESDTLRSAPVAGDLDGDGDAESLVFVAGVRLLGYELGGPLPQRRLDLSLAQLPPLGDDPVFEVVAWPQPQGPDAFLVLFAQEDPRGPDAYLLRVFPQDGEWAYEPFGEGLPHPPTGPPALGDLDGDGGLDVVLSDHERLWAFHDSGPSLTGFPIPIRDQYLVSPRERRVDELKGSPVICDVDGDGANEVVLETRLGVLYAIEAGGENVEGWPRKVSGGGVVSPLVMDYRKDDVRRRALLLFEARGDTVRVGGAVRSARLQKLELPAPPADAPDQRPAEWWGLEGGARRQGRAQEAAGVAPGAVAAQQIQPFVYPNPAGRQPVARVRFWASGPQRARATLLNLEGQERYTTEKQILEQGVGEIELPITDLASGPWLCRLEYEGPGGRATEVLPFYIEN